METLTGFQEQAEHAEHAAGGAAFDPFYSVFKRADVLPLWLKLRHDIRAELEKLMADADRPHPVDLDARIERLNDLIAVYNKHVPNVYLQKPPITRDNWTERYDDWQ